MDINKLGEFDKSQLEKILTEYNKISDVNPFVKKEEDKKSAERLLSLVDADSNNLELLKIIELKAIRWELTALRSVFSISNTKYFELENVYKALGLL